MLPRKLSDGLLTYNFDLEHLTLTIFESETAAIVSKTDYHSNLVLTLRQFKGTLTGKKTKNADIDMGFLFILHSGIHAIVRIILKAKVSSTAR